MLNPFTLEQTMEMVARVKERNRVSGSKRGGMLGVGLVQLGAFPIYGRESNASGSYASGSSPDTNTPKGSVGLHSSNAQSNNHANLTS